LVGEEGHDVGVELGESIRLVNCQEVFDMVGDVVGVVHPGIGEQLTLFESGECIETSVGSGAWLLCWWFSTGAMWVAMGFGENAVVTGLVEVILIRGVLVEVYMTPPRRRGMVPLLTLE
jgi:hypothetical protein